MAKKILIVDDNLQNIKLLGQLLRDRGYKIAIAESGEEALKVVTKVNPDIILLDIIMPGINGYETCIKLKSMDDIKSIPVIFLSALKESINKIEGFEAGGVDYISKPIDSGELFARVHTHLTLSSLQKQLKSDIALKDRLINEIKEKTDELILTQKHLLESQKIASLGYLVTGIAHELNTPLSIGITSSSVIHQKIQGIDKICKDGKITEEELIDDISEMIESNTLLMSSLKRLDKLIKDFKQLSIEQMYSEKKDFKIFDVIRNSIMVTFHLFNRKDIKLTITGNDEIVKESYPDAIERVVTDLTKNSIIHGFKNGSNNKIDVTVVISDKNIIINYYDNGAGIPKKFVTNIFDPFFTTNKSKGPGLGLSVVFNIVNQKLKGKIEYIDDFDGSHFRIDIPKG